MGKIHVHRCRFPEYVPSPVNCIAVNLKQRLLAIGLEDGSIEMWNFETWLLEKVSSALSPPEQLFILP